MPPQLALTPAQWCESFFVLASVFILAAHLTPERSRGALLDYGARQSKPPANEDKRGRQQQPPSHTLGARIIHLAQTLAAIGQVPHRWFLHFYFTSIGWSLFWAFEYLRDGPVIRAVASQQASAGLPTMDHAQVILAWALMTLQGLRRLYESLWVTKPSNSNMWFVHYVLGIMYYTSVGLTIWVQGAGAILDKASGPSFRNVLSVKIVVGVLLYIFACSKQNQCHAYLAGLKKYSLPEADWFRYLICPHYTAECLIYVSLALIAAPRGELFNRTVLFALLFVVVNLGATANGTKEWYASKFGFEKVQKKWRMIPFIF